MNELIKIETHNIANNSVNAVNARDLHNLLEVGRDFSSWVKGRIDKYGFVENLDYVIIQNLSSPVSGSSKARQQVIKDYYISLDMAKELCMVENNDKGREIRRYFIECENRLKEVMSSKDSLLLGIFKAEGDIAKAEAINRYEIGYVKPLEQFKEEAQPKVTYHDLVLKSEDLMNISQIAKDFGLTAQKLNKILHEEGVQYKDKSGVWLLYAEHLPNQYAQTSTSVYQVGEQTHTKLHLKWTQKGRLFIYELLKDKGILPVVEQTG